MTREQAFLISILGTMTVISAIAHVLAASFFITMYRWNKLNSDNIKKLYDHLEGHMRAELERS